MSRYYQIPQDTFNALQLEAGVLLKHFDLAAAAADDDDTGFTDEDIICATTGGINPSCVPSFTDLGEDVDNVPVNMKELKKLDSWECKLSTTALGTSAKLIKMSLGCADIAEDGITVIPRRDLKQKDFGDIWWVGDKANGGFVAIRILNALSTGGFSLQTTKAGKGTSALEITGHVSINAQKTVPMVFYSVDPVNVETYTVDFDSDGGSDVASQQVPSGGLVTEPTDPTKTGYTFDGWYADPTKATPWDFAHTTILSDTTIYAKWVEVAPTTHTVTQTLTHVTSSYTGTTVNDGAAFTATLTAEDTYTLGDVTVTMGGTDITETAYSAGTVTIASATGDIVITAMATS